MSELAISLTKYRVRKANGILTGLRYDSVGLAVDSIMRLVSETHKKNFKMVVKVLPKHINEYVFVDVFTDEDAKAFVRFRIEGEKETTKMVEAASDFDKVNQE